MRNEKTDIYVIEKLAERSRLLGYMNKYLYVFSKSGFDDECLKFAENNENIRLVCFEDMF